MYTNPQPTIQEMNRTIAEFDGWIYTESGKSAKKGKNGNSYPSNAIRYHDKWFWLKPVIDKIFTYALAYPEQVKPIIEMRIVVHIKAAHEKVYEFAKWYLENEKPTKKAGL
jgi:hypothetical protein